MKVNKALTAILLVGVIIRAYLIFTRSIYTDEVLYYQVAQNNSIKDLILMNHWMKDHGFLYQILLKILLFFTSEMSLLRLSNIVFYIGSAYILYSLFTYFHFGRWALFPVFIFSVHRYFIYMSSMVSPYNMAIFFTLLSIYYCARLFLTEKKISLIDCMVFILSTSLAFYFDYSFLSVGVFYVLVLTGVYVYRKPKRPLLNIMYGFVGLFVLPGIIQLGKNLGLIQTLNNSLEREDSLFLSLYEFCKMTVLHSKSAFPLYFFTLYFSLCISVIIIFAYNKKFFKQWTFFLLITVSYYLSVCCFLLINQFIFASFVQRSFWFFFLFETMLISSLVYLYHKKNKYIFLLIIIVYCISLIFNICKTQAVDDYLAPGDVAHTISYKEFMSHYLADKEAIKDSYIFLIDEGYAFIPLQKYYFPTLSIPIAHTIQEHIKGQTLHVVPVSQKRRIPSRFFQQCGTSYTLVFLNNSIGGKGNNQQKSLEKNARSIYRLWQKNSGGYILLKEK